MPKGGARARSGPAPTSRERSHKAGADRSDWTVLPADGRDGPLPAFPLMDPTPREYELWERLWETPQAVQWEMQNQAFAVAGYVRVLARAEMPKSSSIIWSEERQRAEALGLSVSGMQRNRWVVANADVTDADDEPADNSSVPSLTERLKLVSGD